MDHLKAALFPARMTLNPNATSFSFNVAASTFTPTFSSSASSSEPINSGHSLSSQAFQLIDRDLDPYPPPPPDNLTEQGEEPIDENDPLWIATLKITNGNREEALRLLEDPDALSIYPEIKAILEGGSADDWDGHTSAEVVPEPATVSEAVHVSSAAASPIVDKKESSAAATAAAAGEDGIIEDDGNIQDCDPRQHLNLVFIGHVDAGKVRSSRTLNAFLILILFSLP